MTVDMDGMILEDYRLAKGIEGDVEIWQSCGASGTAKKIFWSPRLTARSSKAIGTSCGIALAVLRRASLGIILKRLKDLALRSGRWFVKNLMFHVSNTCLLPRGVRPRVARELASGVFRLRITEHSPWIFLSHIVGHRGFVAYQHEA